MINPAPYILKDRTSRSGFTYTVTFPVNSMQGFGFTVEHQGRIASVTAMNVASYSLRKNGSAVGVPFSVERGDVLMIDDVVKIDDGRASSFVLRAQKFDQQNVDIIAPTQIDLTRKHLFVVNYSDQTVSVIDTETDTVESTLILPTTGVGKGYEFQSIAYRSADDHMYVFGSSRVCKINANPASPDFKKIYSPAGVLDGSLNLGAGTPYPYTTPVYDYINDLMFLGFTRFNRTDRWNFEGSIPLEDRLTGLGNPSAFFIPNNKLILSGRMIVAKMENEIPTSWSIDGNSLTSVKGSYKSSTNSFFAGTSVVREFDADTLELVAQFAGTGSGGVANFAQSMGNIIYSPFYNIVLGLTYEYNGGQIAVIDSDAGTVEGVFARTNKEANDTIARSMVYGAFAKKFYFLGNGTSPVTRLHKLNPQLWIDNGKVDVADMIDGYITVGDVSIMDGDSVNADGRRYQNCACAFNHLIPS